jgi:hypothetical protein
MKNLKVHRSPVCPAPSFRLSWENLSLSALTWLVIFTGCLWSGTLALAQVPTNQLHFAFTDAPGGTTTLSDTTLNPGAIVTTVTMYNAASPAVAVDLHGPVCSGVANPGVVSTIRSLDFTADTVVTSQTNQPANSKPVPPFVIAGGSAETGANPASGSGNAAFAADFADTALANLGNSGSVGPFVATIWMNLNCAIPAGETVCPRIWILNQTTGAAQGLDTGNAGAPGSLGLKFQQNNQVAFSSGTANPTLLGTLPSGTFPTNTWMFFAVVYDSTNYYIYYATPSTSPIQIGKVAVANATYSMGASGTLVFGNRHTATTYNTRGLDGWENDFRFYSGGYGNLAFVQSIWGSAIGNPPVVTSAYPDGTLLLQGTNTFTFTASSPIGLNLTNVTLQLNGVNVSPQLTVVTNGTSGTSSNLSFSYPNLQPNQGNTAVITMQDAAGSIANGSVTFDTFYATNFIWEAEEFDALNPTNGTPDFFIDNPLYTATNAVDINGGATSYYQLDSVEGIDTHKGTGNPAANASDYRVEGDTVSNFKTQTPASTDVNRQKFIDAAVGDPGVVDHVVGNWATAEWQNYTKTFPAGQYNIYGRLSSSAAATITFAQVTSGQGTSSQTLTNIGSFNFNSGGIGTYAYVPLKDSLGNLVVVTNLAGVSTVRITSGGGANANFYMLIPANTNLPSITAVNPSGAVLFQPTNTLVFTASSAVGISTNSITVTVNGINVSNLLVFSGSSVSWNVSYPHLQTNNTYAVVIRVTDANGNSANSTLNIDTYDPTFTWEAEDFDFGGGQYIDNPLPTTTPNTAGNSYCERVSAPGIAGQAGIDAFATANGVSAGDYREHDIIACTPNFDTARLLFLTNNAQDYALGFLAATDWENYTKTFPSGTYNVYGRMANGQNPAAVVNAALITKGWGTTAQFTQSLGTFTVPNVGWSSFSHIPLRDKYGNFANVTLNGTNTIRTTELNAVNINFYMLTAARTDLPRIDNVSPDGSVLMQSANTFSFTASSPLNGVNTNNIHVTLNGVNLTNLVFSGSAASWNVSYPGLLPNTSYTAVINMTDNVNQAHSPVTVSFDTFNPTNFTWEAEDFDFDPTLSPVAGGSGLRYIDNPVLADANSEATNAYFGQTGASGIDESPSFQSIAGTYLYRGSSDFVSTEVTSDAPRQTYLNAQLAKNDPPYLNNAGIVDYDVNHILAGGWIDYTRTYPTGNFYLYARLSAGNGAFKLQCAQVTNGAGTSMQSSNVLGNFIGTGASFATWQYVPLVDANTNRVVLSLGGVETLQITGDTNENANFFVLVPAAAAVNTDPATANFTFTVTGGGGGGGGSQTLNFFWAPDHIGWQLYSNSVGLTASSSWFAVPGSATVTNKSTAIDQSKTNVFFQLRYP